MMFWDKDLNIQQLDKTLSRFEETRHIPVPPQGWINAIRTALGMSAKKLGERIGLSQPRVALIEKGEIEGSISLKTLEKTAQGLGCKVVYVLIPEEGSLKKIRENQAIKKARKINQYVEHHMALEEQETNEEFKEQCIKELADDFLRNWPRNFWDE